MPIYEFKCSACDHVFERLQKSETVKSDAAKPAAGKPEAAASTAKAAPATTSKD